jgi:hypothetical protein
MTKSKIALAIAALLVSGASVAFAGELEESRFGDTYPIAHATVHNGSGLDAYAMDASSAVRPFTAAEQWQFNRQNRIGD